MRFIIFSIALLFFSQINLYAQNTDSLIFKGNIRVNDAGTYKYKLVIGENSGKWQGYSLLDEGGPNETKTSVIANFVKSKKAMAFAERKLISTSSKEPNFCFVIGLLKMNTKKKELRGMFVGQDKQKKPCGSGSVNFDLPEKAITLMTPDGKKDTGAKTAIITSQMSESIKVFSDSLSIEIWDGGVEDNDSISISVNNIIIEPAILITKEKKRLQLSLKKGENIIHIKALNEGTEPPNSARFMILGGNKSHPVVSFLRKGEMATIKINR